VASAAVFNTLQNFMTLKLTRRVYNNVSAASGMCLCMPSGVSYTLLTSHCPPCSHLRCLDLNFSSRAILRRLPHSRKSVCAILCGPCGATHNKSEFMTWLYSRTSSHLDTFRQNCSSSGQQESTQAFSAQYLYQVCIDCLDIRCHY